MPILGSSRLEWSRMRAFRCARLLIVKTSKGAHSILGVLPIKREVFMQGIEICSCFCLQRRMERSQPRRMRTGGMRPRRGTPLTWTPCRCTRATARRPALRSAMRLTWLEVRNIDKSFFNLSICWLLLALPEHACMPANSCVSADFGAP